MNFGLTAFGDAVIGALAYVAGVYTAPWVAAAWAKIKAVVTAIKS